MARIPKHPHVVKRQQQRGLKEEVLEFIVDFGDVEFGAGAIWYVIRERSLPSYLRGTQIVEKAKPWVVMARPRGRGGEILVTAYPRNDASRHVRRKGRLPMKPWN